MDSLAVTFWPGHCLGQGKVAFGNSFAWIVSTLMRLQKISKCPIWLTYDNFQISHVLHRITLVNEIMTFRKHIGWILLVFIRMPKHIKILPTV